MNLTVFDKPVTKIEIQKEKSHLQFWDENLTYKRTIGTHKQMIQQEISTEKINNLTTKK